MVADSGRTETASRGARPTAVVLFSAGKDSALAATLLDPFYEVVLCHCRFGIDTEPPVTAVAEAAATEFGLPLATVELDGAVAREAVERMVADGYPRAGIQSVHEHALETVASRETLTINREERAFAVLADGTRRDDRVPGVDRAFAQSLEDRHGVAYVRPLLGYGRSAIDDLADRYLTVESGPSDQLATADYETELRELMAAEYGPETVDAVFPDHVQSRVIGRHR